MDRACDVGVGLEQSCNGKTKKYRAMGDGCPLRAPTAINKGQEEEACWSNRCHVPDKTDRRRWRESEVDDA